jgi:CheY-like chemotaxis protein
MNILFADDDEGYRLIVIYALERQGHTVEAVEDGNQLLERVNQPNSDFDVVITDYNMPPGRSGIDVLRVLQSDPRFKTLSVIVHSANTNKHIKSVVEELGGVFVQKMSSNADLLAALDALKK